MTKFKNIKFILGLMLMGVLFTLGSSVHAQGEEELNVAYVAAISSLDPHTGIHGGEQQVLWALFDSLIRFDEDINLLPGLAESWEYTDPTTLLLHIRPGVTFHDGTELNAEAVKWNFERQMDPEVDATTQGEFSLVESIEVVDEHTLKITFSAPTASFLGALTDRAGMMVSPAAVEQHGDAFGRSPVGAGPFVFDRWVEGSYWTLTKNPDFWEEGYPKLDRLTFNYFELPEAAMQALKAGQIDFYQEFPSHELPWVQQSPNYEFVNAPTLKLRTIYVNAADAPFDNLALRKAVAYSLDREALTAAFGGEGAEPAAGYWPIGYWAKDPDVQFYSYDPEMAAQKLQEAYDTGYDGTPLKVCSNNIGITPEIAQAVHSMVADAGIPIELMIADNTTISTRIHSERICPFYVSTWSGRTDPDQTATGLFHSAGGFLPPRSADPSEKGDAELDRLIEAARTELDPEKRRELYSQVEQRAIDLVFMMPVFGIGWETAVASNVTGFEPGLIGKPIYRTMDIE